MKHQLDTKTSELDKFKNMFSEAKSTLTQFQRDKIDKSKLVHENKVKSDKFEELYKLTKQDLKEVKQERNKLISIIGNYEKKRSESSENFFTLKEKEKNSVKERRRIETKLVNTIQKYENLKSQLNHSNEKFRKFKIKTEIEVNKFLCQKDNEIINLQKRLIQTEQERDDFREAEMSLRTELLFLREINLKSHEITKERFDKKSQQVDKMKNILDENENNLEKIKNIENENRDFRLLIENLKNEKEIVERVKENEKKSYAEILNKKEGEIESLVKLSEASAEEITKMQEKIFYFEEQLKKLESVEYENEKLYLENQDFFKEIKFLKDELIERDNQINGFQSEFETLVINHERIKQNEEEKKKKLKNFEEEKKNFEKKIQKIEEEKKIFDDEKINFEAKFRLLKEKNRHLESKSQEDKSGIIFKLEEFMRAQKEIYNSKLKLQEKEHLREIDTLKTVLNSIQDQMTSNQTEIKKLISELEKKNENLNKRNIEISKLTLEKKNLENKILLLESKINKNFNLSIDNDTNSYPHQQEQRTNPQQKKVKTFSTKDLWESFKKALNQRNTPQEPHCFSEVNLKDIPEDIEMKLNQFISSIKTNSQSPQNFINFQNFSRKLNSNENENKSLDSDMKPIKIDQEMDDSFQEYHRRMNSGENENVFGLGTKPENSFEKLKNEKKVEKKKKNEKVVESMIRYELDPAPHRMLDSDVDIETLDNEGSSRELDLPSRFGTLAPNIINTEYNSKKNSIASKNLHVFASNEKEKMDEMKYEIERLMRENNELKNRRKQSKDLKEEKNVFEKSEDIEENEPKVICPPDMNSGKCLISFMPNKLNAQLQKPPNDGKNLDFSAKKNPQRINSFRHHNPNMGFESFDENSKSRTETKTDNQESKESYQSPPPIRNTINPMLLKLANHMKKKGKEEKPQPQPEPETIPIRNTINPMLLKIANQVKKAGEKKLNLPLLNLDKAKEIQDFENIPKKSQDFVEENNIFLELPPDSQYENSPGEESNHERTLLEHELKEQKDKIRALQERLSEVKQRNGYTEEETVRNEEEEVAGSGGETERMVFEKIQFIEDKVIELQALELGDEEIEQKKAVEEIIENL